MSPKARICSRSVAELIEMYECGEISASKYEMVRLSDADYLIKVARFKRGLSRVPKEVFAHQLAPHDEIEGCTFLELPKELRQRFNRHTISTILISRRS